MDQKTNTRTQPTQGHQGQQRPDRDQNRDSQEPNNDRDQAEGSRDRGGAGDMGGPARGRESRGSSGISNRGMSTSEEQSDLPSRGATGEGSRDQSER